MGWPEKTKDLKTFYPTSLLVTAQDIIYLWVARMVFSSLEFLNKIPFKDVYIHATILNKEGKRMSKSLGTGIDPLELIEKYGADATRFGLLYMTSRDQQAVKFSEDTIRANRNFCNKLWNINRFIRVFSNKPQHESLKDKNLTDDDKWILKRLNETIKSVTNKIENYEFGESARELYEFVWHEYADKYIEASKKQEKNVNIYVFETILRLLHPFMPFITESIWQMNYKQKDALIISEWPKIKK
ncbi:MAG: class I tRNA ligase family protein [Candidatus Portnoybacteria bacterium]|nr:class I tRNA ligase family protein [Candidatus Portnoybacteria bacterium]